MKIKMSVGLSKIFFCMNLKYHILVQAPRTVSMTKMKEMKGHISRKTNTRNVLFIEKKYPKCSVHIKKTENSKYKNINMKCVQFDIAT